MFDLGLLYYQLFPPTFTMAILYTILASTIVYIISQLFLQNKPRAKSLIYLTPLFAPLAAFLVNPDPLTIFSWQVSTVQVNIVASLHPGLETFSPQPPPGALTISVFGVLSLIGLAVSIGYLAVMYTIGDKVVSRLCGVVQLSQDEDPQLFGLVNRLSNCMQITPPKVGMIDDLKPNAFTLGRGKMLTLVCSIGLLELLNEQEMEAVIAHELAHVKNRDFNLKALTSVLKIASFYNPLVYLFSSAVSRQREILADEIGSGSLANSESLGRALLKIAEASLNFPSDGFKGLIVSSLFIVSPVRSVRSVLSSHPPIVNRLSHLIEHEKVDRRSFQQILLLCACFTFLTLVGLSIYQLLASVTIVSFADGGSGVVARASTGSAITYQFGIMKFVLMSLIGPFPLSLHPFSLTLHLAGGQMGNSVMVYHGVRMTEWYTSDGIYSLLLSLANIGLAVAILVGAILPAKRNATTNRTLR